MSNMLVYGVLFVSVLVLLFAFTYGARLVQKKKEEAAQKKREAERKKAALAGLLINCPLCNSYLLKGENLVSRVYRPMNVPDQLCIIQGCPHCYPKMEAGVQRKCPVCGKDVALDAHLVSRLFNYKDGKKHVRVMGCVNCCRNSPQ